MIVRSVLIALVLLIFAGPAVAQEGAGATAYAQFEQLQNQWMDLERQIRELHQKRADKKQLVALRKNSDELLDQLAQTGLEVYRADPQGYPVVNETLRAIANFHVVGDPNGDGGDQYEKALPLVKDLIDAGAAKDWPELWLLGAVSAYCTNDYKLAGEYFARADAVGAARQADRLGQLAQGFQQSLATTARNWQAEAKIRAAEQQADDLPRVKLTTTRGDIVIELFENEAPQATANFITLVKKDFYTGVPFHRVLPGFMAQGGDPTGTGGGGPGYSIRCECHAPNHRKHFRGTLSMAHAGRDTGGSQFFLTFVPTVHLDGRHTVFGRVIEGMDVAASLKRRDPANPHSPADEILSAEVLRDRGHAYQFQKLPER